jgi:putative flippase GtrA
MNRFWSFKSKTSIKGQLVAYTLLFAFNLLASSAIIYILTDFLGFIPLISKLFAMGAVVSWNFILYKKVIYK